MTKRLVAPLALVALAGCGSGNDVALKNVSVQDAAEQARAEIKLQPGQWQTTANIGDIAMPGAPPEVQQALSKSLAKTNTVADCLTPAEAANPSAQMMTGGSGGQCRYENFRMSGGTMDAVMVCTQPGQQGEMRSTLKGSYAPTEYAIDMAMKVAMPGAPGGQAMTMNAKVAGKRIGECPAGAS